LILVGIAGPARSLGACRARAPPNGRIHLHRRRAAARRPQSRLDDNDAQFPGVREQFRARSQPVAGSRNGPTSSCATTFPTIGCAARRCRASPACPPILHRIDPSSTWTGRSAPSGGYLLFSATYADAAARRSLGWPCREIPSRHFHMLVDPAAVTAAIIDLSGRCAHPTSSVARMHCSRARVSVVPTPVG
jgi:hypothetical protein